jgi:ABC-2 type transport system ATP-binding protein
MKEIEISARSLRKTYRVPALKVAGKSGPWWKLGPRQTRELVAVDNIDFEIFRGEIVGYLGANGAGKSTTIKMMAGALFPTSGELRVAGRVPYLDREENARCISVVYGQRSQLYWELPATDSFELARALYRIPDAVYKRNVAKYTELLDLGELLTRPVRQLSLGQKARVNIAYSLLHDPRVLYLDEPTIGLDVLAKHQIRNCLREINAERGTTMVITSHDVSDIEELCPRVIMIDRGKVAYDGSLPKFKAQYGRSRQIEVSFHRPPAVPLAFDGLILVNSSKMSATYEVLKSELLPAVLAAISAAEDVRDISIHEPNIESILRAFYEKVRGDRPQL